MNKNSFAFFSSHSHTLADKKDLNLSHPPLPPLLQIKFIDFVCLLLTSINNHNVIVVLLLMRCGTHITDQTRNGTVHHHPHGTTNRNFNHPPQIHVCEPTKAITPTTIGARGPRLALNLVRPRKCPKGAPVPDQLAGRTNTHSRDRHHRDHSR